MLNCGSGGEESEWQEHLWLRKHILIILQPEFCLWPAPTWNRAFNQLLLLQWGSHSHMWVETEPEVILAVCACGSPAVNSGSGCFHCWNRRKASAVPGREALRRCRLFEACITAAPRPRRSGEEFWHRSGPKPTQFGTFASFCRFLLFICAMKDVEFVDILYPCTCVRLGHKRVSITSEEPLLPPLD